MTEETKTEGEVKSLAAIDIQKILVLLPHRYPFLLVDKIEQIDADLSCVGTKNVTANEPHFQGHFPDNPVMPGVLIIEGMAQTAGAICILNKGADAKPSLVYFMTIDEAKFRRPVRPGDVLEYHMTRLNKRRNMWWYKGEAKVNGEIVAEAKVGAMIAEE
ncbi:3-hydroxyacyl-[acyl-carrier-protein] dehydratase FabZ [Azorhizobium oxalatiphilum]|uniref:3-hydroxyacyl-[acyl-carrier-protein] dehydratase FabZ n=1 Tax=Azorhizobium oxalatiphilum TaxID=980631 RepID=A0A917FHQ4_9HYPH|nr:3-hydroxyacyl-ACP dehydratase FabZ [Azorhizobium oxalatiphilum]GGF83909.1 3-hydroxyacyl-[acyl-carrier-protein] dehydratase FabZ [Azorhizobium oxalatiphilum]